MATDANHFTAYRTGDRELGPLMIIGGRGGLRIGLGRAVTGPMSPPFFFGPMMHSTLTWGFGRRCGSLECSTVEIAASANANKETNPLDNETH